MPVMIHNREYVTVAERVGLFRDQFKHEYSILTEILSNAEEIVVRAWIEDGNGRTVATGHAAEIRGSTTINRTSALENAETSAIGRALAAFGFAGTEYASADELQNAKTQQAVQEATDRLLAHQEAVRRLWPTIHAIKTGIEFNDLSSASEAWFELNDDEKKSIWLAPTKGGIFTTEERKVMQSKEFREANGAFE